jgi:hypothetical protein
MNTTRMMVVATLTLPHVMAALRFDQRANGVHLSYHSMATLIAR